MLALAELWSDWSTCPRRRVGAVIFDPTNYAVISVGYNDTPTGAKDCGDGGCVACDQGSVSGRTDCLCVHAEMNAILLARTDIRGMHLAVWNVKDGKPVTKNSLCIGCLKHRQQAGITAVLVGDRETETYVRE